MFSGGESGEKMLHKLSFACNKYLKNITGILCAEPLLPLNFGVFGLQPQHCVVRLVILSKGIQMF